MKLLERAFTENKAVKLIDGNQFYSVHKRDGEFSISPVGGGFAKKVVGDDSIFEIVELMPSEFIKGVFHLDAVEELIFEGYSIPTNRWNGWAIPVFEIEVAKQIAKVVNGTMSDCYAVRRDDENGKFVIEEKDYDEESDEKDFIINVDGKDLVVVGFMGANWCWEGCYDEEAKKMLARAVPYTSKED
ncbi:hypothetical protein LMH73_027030 [Vibrio splendidus]|nr:hypothetical protein [Vibrio splendidus]MCC4882952.1 hypothetical protein [Vibrio splendidus]